MFFCWQALALRRKRPAGHSEQDLAPTVRTDQGALCHMTPLVHSCSSCTACLASGWINVHNNAGALPLSTHQTHCACIGSPWPEGERQRAQGLLPWAANRSPWSEHLRMSGCAAVDRPATASVSACYRTLLGYWAAAAAAAAAGPWQPAAHLRSTRCNQPKSSMSQRAHCSKWLAAA